jgi:hypothetical protein
MSWLRIAADLLRDAISSPSEPPTLVEQAPPPADISQVVDLLNRHRAEIDKNFEAVVGMLESQKKRHLNAIQIQRRWNYGLTAAVILLAIGLIASFWRI